MLLTLQIFKWRLRILCVKVPTEKLASKILRFHKSAIFSHSYFIRAELHPFCCKKNVSYKLTHLQLVRLSLRLG